MTKKLDPYAELGVPKNADAAAIKRAYRKKAKSTHPDAGGKAEAFERVHKANLVLSDPDRRAKFDATGEVDETAAETVEGKAMALIAGFLAGVLDGDIDPTAIDLVSFLTERIRDELTKLEAKLAPMRRAVARAKRVELKFKRKRQGQNMLARMVESHRKTLEQVITQGAKQREIGETALALVADYTYDADKPAPKPRPSLFGPNQDEINAMIWGRR